MKKGALWPAAIVGLIGLNVSIVGVTVYLATSDPSAVVEPGYYEKALAWNQTARLRDASVRLGWKAGIGVTADRLTVRLSDSAGAPVAGAAVSVVAFADARAGDRQDLSLAEYSPGEYAGPMRVSRAGLWQFRIEARRGADTFVSTIEQDLATDTADGHANPPVADGRRASP